ncbi:MAG: methyltransferase [Bacilli bacterium]|nr:methyltransferase [Bacilli bacterium]
MLWQQKLNEVVKSWLGEERRAGNSTYTPPIERFEHIVARTNFRDVERRLLPSYSYIWTIDSIIGNLYSTSFASSRFFGDQLSRFEDDIKSALLEIDAAGVFTEALTVSVITASNKN